MIWGKGGVGFFGTGFRLADKLTRDIRCIKHRPIVHSEHSNATSLHTHILFLQDSTYSALNKNTKNNLHHPNRPISQHQLGPSLLSFPKVPHPRPHNLNSLSK